MKKLLIGGTHGNEWTGIYLLKYFSKNQYFNDCVLANPKAFAQNKRFVDEDLNRCFSKEKIESPHGIYERTRAGELLEKIKDSDLLVDLHTTTSNMGPTIIFSKKSNQVFKVLAYVQSKYPELKFLFNPDPNEQYMISHAKLGFVIEVGPVANSCLKADVFESSKKIAILISEGLESEVNMPESLEYYSYEKKIDYRFDEDSNLASMVHANIQDKDFVALKEGQPVLQSFEAEDIFVNGIEGLYPIFINEAAYYNYKYALQLVKKETWFRPVD
ncbi:MAG: aspartoacylase [Bdellovibrionota bacterium]|nr:aspartoacylase [Bdellovibrionota bacterium]